MAALTKWVTALGWVAPPGPVTTPGWLVLIGLMGPIALAVTAVPVGAVGPAEPRRSRPGPLEVRAGPALGRHAARRLVRRAVPPAARQAHQHPQAQDPQAPGPPSAPGPPDT